jgi:Calx-beta domain
MKSIATFQLVSWFLLAVYADQGYLLLALARGPGTYGSVSVLYSTTDVTARLGIDYFTGNQPVPVSFADSVTQATINISLTNDGLAHPAKQFIVNLVYATGAFDNYQIYIV